MQVRQIRPRILHAAAALFVLVVTGAGMAAVPVAASAASLTIASGAAAAPDAAIPLTAVAPLAEGPGTVEMEHNCNIIGNTVFFDPPGSSNSVEAVNCTDVFVEQVGGTTGDEVFVQNEISCQWAAGPNEGETFPCSGIDEQVGAGSPLGTAALPAQLCGTISGQTHSPCTSGRTKHAAFAFGYQPPGKIPSVKCTIWGESLRVSVILPISGHPTVSETVLATDPVNIFASSNARGHCLDL
jgi:hypothetical protein